MTPKFTSNGYSPLLWGRHEYVQVIQDKSLTTPYGLNRFFNFFTVLNDVHQHKESDLGGLLQSQHCLTAALSISIWWKESTISSSCICWHWYWGCSWGQGPRTSNVLQHIPAPVSSGTKQTWPDTIPVTADWVSWKARAGSRPCSSQSPSAASD